MNKHDENKLSDSIIALYKEIKGMRGDMEKQLSKVNLVIGELRLSYMKLDERVEKLDKNMNAAIKTLDESFNRYAESNEARLNGHENRIKHLEEKTSDSSYLQEPAAKYRKRKKRK